MPVDLRYDSAFCAIYRGSREYASPVTGSFTLQIRMSVGAAAKGSMNAVEASGTKSMSLSWISWKPRILEPSNPRPSSKASTENSFVDKVKCCQRPGRSTNRTSTALIPFSSMSAMTSFGSIRFPP